MSNNRWLIIVAVVALFGVAAFIVQTSTAMPIVSPNRAAYSSAALRKPSGEISLSAAEPSDWFERHPETVNAANAVNLSDYFQRHPDSLKPGNRTDSSNPVDRYPESIIQRHPELLEQANPSNQLDPVQRHRDNFNR